MDLSTEKLNKTKISRNKFAMRFNTWIKIQTLSTYKIAWKNQLPWESSITGVTEKTEGEMN